MKRLLIFFICILSISVLPVHAEEPDDDSFVSITASGRHIGSAEFSDADGKGQVTSGGLEVEISGFSFSYTANSYSWSDKRSLPFGNGTDDPWDTLHQLSLGYEYDADINKNWGYSLALTVDSSFEKETSDSYGAAFRAGLEYEFNEHWSTRFGGRVAANSIETEVMPYLAVSYENFAKDGSGTFMTLGLPQTEAGYSFNESSTIRASFELAGETYRLKDDSTVVRKGYVENSSMLAGIYYDWKPTGAFSLSVGPEYHFGREVQLYDSDGYEVGDAHELDSAWGGSLMFRYEF